MTAAKIVMDGHGHGSVFVDGEDVTKRVRGMCFTASAQECNVLRLDLIPSEVTVEAAEVNVLDMPHEQFQPDQYLVFVDRPLRVEQAAEVAAAAKSALKSENVFVVGAGVSVAKVPHLDVLDRIERKLDLVLQLVGQPESFGSQ